MGTTVWNQGLLGQGQIVGVSDSGLDWRSCFFRDPFAEDFNGNIPLGVPIPGHRKVFLYDPLQDAFDVFQGHGTHVAGTVLGSIAGFGGFW